MTFGEMVEFSLNFLPFYLCCPISGAIFSIFTQKAFLGHYSKQAIHVYML